MDFVSCETMETLTNCPICNHDKFNAFLSCMDYYVSHETFQIVRCEKCGFRFTNPRPDETEIKKYYISDEYISHSSTPKGLVNKIYCRVRKFTIRKKLSLVEEIRRNQKKGTKSILDFGCGTGEFISACRKRSWNIYGVEPSEIARKNAQEQHSIVPLSTEEFFKFNKKIFNIITLWHVLEHIHRIDDALKQFHRTLNDDGVLIIAVPNNNSYDAQKYGSCWAAYDLPRHLFHFIQRDMESLMEKHGFKLTRILPMKFDSYYVSFLSERYKSGKSQSSQFPLYKGGLRGIFLLFNGFLTGWKSNIYSKKFGHSSQIYVFTKNS